MPEIDTDVQEWEGICGKNRETSTFQFYSVNFPKKGGARGTPTRCIKPCENPCEEAISDKEMEKIIKDIFDEYAEIDRGQSTLGGIKDEV